MILQKFVTGSPRSMPHYAGIADLWNGSNSYQRLEIIAEALLFAVDDSSRSKLPFLITRFRFNNPIKAVAHMRGSDGAPAAPASIREGDVNDHAASPGLIQRFLSYATSGSSISDSCRTTTTIPESVTWKRRLSASVSYPISVRSGRVTWRSMIARRIRECRPTFTWL